MKLMRFFIVSVMMIAVNAYSQTVRLEKISSELYTKKEIYSLDEVLKSSVAKVEGYKVISNGQADILLRPDLFNFGETYMLKLTKVKNNQDIRSLKVKFEGLSDLDSASDRIVSAILLDKNFQETRTVENVIESEKKMYTQRVEALRQLKLKKLSAM